MRTGALSGANVVHAVGATVIALIGVGGYIGGVSPAQASQSRIALLRSSLAEASEEEESLRRKNREAESNLRAAGERLRTRGVTLLRGDQLNATLERVSNLASEYGLIVDSLSSAAPVEEGRFRRVPLRLSGRTTPRGVAAFMRATRERFSDVTVRTFELRSEVANQTASATVQMELDWYASKSDK